MEKRLKDCFSFFCRNIGYVLLLSSIFLKFEIRCFFKKGGTMKKEYESPESRVLDLVYEGILCGSNENLDEIWGEWDFVKDIN